MASTESLMDFVKNKTIIGKDMSEGELLNFSNSLLQQYSNDEPIKFLFDDLAKPIVGMVSHAFILCFSKTYKNPLMWSHYSNSHSVYER